MANIPPTITPPPDGPQRGDRATFAGRVDAFITWLIASVAQFAALAANVYANAVDAFTSATAAGASASAAAVAAEVASAVVGAAQWVSGTTYATGANVWSPSTLQTYRRKVAGSGSTDPSSDPANWTAVTGPAFTNIAVITTTQTWTPPANVFKAKVTVIGGGASNNTGVNAQLGGPAGGAAIKILAVSSSVSYTATIGAGGVARTTAGLGNSGGASSFSGAGITTISATGGDGATNQGGIGSGGDLNIRGGSASSSTPNSGGMTAIGGGSLLSGNAEQDTIGNPYGGGAGGGYDNSTTGKAGAAGVIIIEY